MNCWKGQCKYCTDENRCTVDDKLCDLKSQPIFGTGLTEHHCRQDQKEELCSVSADACLMPNAPLMAFWSCENICKYYDNCEEK